MVWNRVVAAYRWRKILASCRLNPSELLRPLAEPTPDDFIIAGCPRTGTSLLAAVLFQPPEVITSMEPWDGLRMPPADLFASLRAEIETTGELSRGRLDPQAVRDTGQVKWQRDRETSSQVDMCPVFQLGVKWPAFWRYLDLLPDTRFLITFRHPLEVLSSFERKGGRLASGLDYKVSFNTEMNNTLLAATNDPLERRVLMYEYIYSRILPHLERPNVLAVRYERWFGDPEGLCREISAFLGITNLEPNVQIKEPQLPSRQPELVELIHRVAPSGRALGYDV